MLKTMTNTCFAHAGSKLPNIVVGHDDLWHRSDGGDRLGDRPKCLHLDLRIRLHVKMHSTYFIGHEHFGASTLISADHRSRLLASAAAEHDPFRLAPSGEARRIAPPTAMVRRQKHITVVRG